MTTPEDSKPDRLRMEELRLIQHPDVEDAASEQEFEGLRDREPTGESPGKREPPSPATRRVMDFLDMVRKDLGQRNHTPEQNTSGTGDTVRNATATRRVDDSSQSEILDAGHPSNVGRFEILRLLGQGGFADVFLAHDPTLNRQVALKILREPRTFPTTVSTRFEREARAAALLSHPNIVPVFETGMIKGVRYIATGFCDGQTLQKWMDERDQPPEPHLAARMVVTLAGALEHAHQRGIVHRDLKPANILISHEPDSEVAEGPGHLMIADFGLARLQETDNQKLTHEGTIIGTPLYMSPEQARGDSGTGAAGDIYSLGVILYELLTGSLPLRGATNIETLLKIAGESPVPPRKLRSRIPADLDAICLRCLEKAPVDRYASAFELSEDLRRFLSGEPVAARPVRKATRAVRWCARNPGFSFAFAAVAFAFILASLQWLRAEQSNDRAEQHLATAQDVISEMANRLASDEDLPPELRRSFTERAVTLQRRLQQDEPHNEDIATRTAIASHQLIVVLFDLGEFDEALKVSRETSAMLEPFADTTRVQSLRQASLRYEATMLRMLNELDESSEIVEELQTSVDTSVIDQARNHLEAGQNLLHRRNHAEAIRELESALDIFESLSGGDSHHAGADLARTHFFLGLARFEQGDHHQALPAFDDALAEFTVLANHPRAGTAYLEDAGRCYLQKGIIHAVWSLPPDDQPSPEQLEIARENYRKANATFREVRAADPGRVVVYGLEFMSLEMHIELEYKHQQSDRITTLLDSMQEILDATPENMPEYPLMKRILVQAKLKQARLLLKSSELAGAATLVDDCDALLKELTASNPGLKDLQSVVSSFENLRDLLNEETASDE